MSKDCEQNRDALSQFMPQCRAELQLRLTWTVFLRQSVRRNAHNTPDAILIADAADLAVGEIDLDHVLRRADQGQGLVGVGVEYLGAVIAALVRRYIGVVAFDVESDPM